MEEFTTPMMKQYYAIKKQYADCLLFYRMGDFYELFLEDAHIGAKVLDITLTGKSNGKNSRIPMAGVPYHAVDNYLNKLVKAGYKVAICEQISLPNKYGLVDRAVVRIVTPGTILDEKSLNKKDNNYIISLLVDGNSLAISAADISTGYFQTMELHTETPEQHILDELSRLHPAECILPPDLYNNPKILQIVKTYNDLNIFCYQEWDEYAEKANSFLKDHFNVSSLAGFGIDDKPLSQQTAAALLSYLRHTQQGTVSHIQNIISVTPQDFMQLDRATIINLELFSTIREHDTRGSLLSVIDETQTAMGGRLLKEWVRKPLINKEQITERHDAVEELLLGKSQRIILQEKLRGVADIERMLSRLAVGIGNARDLINLKNSLATIVQIKLITGGLQTSLLQQLTEEIVPQIETIIETITSTLKDEPGIDLRNGNLIRDGVNNELDSLRKTVLHSKEWIIALENTERKNTGISSLKVRYNKVFGFYIEVSKANVHLIPATYIRKQTLVNGERYITPELKEQEEIILNAEERIFDLEYELFQQLLKKILHFTPDIQSAAKSIAALDCLLSFAFISEKNQYVRPLFSQTQNLVIKQGRHPVVEKLLPAEKQFVPNDVTLDETQSLLIITGPNMAGKSVLIRQTAVIMLLHQIGCFVPATQAILPVTDRIFVRSGASDVITSGLSTFMVEMVETAHILHHATEKSLIIMDEIGRGTSTYDGISIAWAVAEYLARDETHSPKTLFATHYHELKSLEDEHQGMIKNYHMAVIEDNGQPIFLHTLVPGGASSSFGVAVAKLAGIPGDVLSQANDMLAHLEQRSLNQSDSFISPTQPTNIIEHFVAKELEEIDIHQMTPLEALNKLADLKAKLKLLHTQPEIFKEVD